MLAFQTAKPRETLSERKARWARNGSFWRLMIQDIREDWPGDHFLERNIATNDKLFGDRAADPLREAYRDALAMAAHLKQAIIERDGARGR